jgi:hypothetical protein
MPNFVEYGKSIAAELNAKKNRVRNFIDGRHWAEDGRYKESILIDAIKPYLPEGVRIGTGFAIKNHPDQYAEHLITKQLDIVIYDSRPVVFKSNDFVIVSADSVLSIIEVKSNLNSSNVQEAIENAHSNGEILPDGIFNGIFAYDINFDFVNNGVADSMSTALISHSKKINHIVCGAEIFFKYWKRDTVVGNEQNHNTITQDLYRGYRFEQELSYAYFLGNLIESVYGKVTKADLDDVIRNTYFSLPETKEGHPLRNGDIIV